VTQNLQTEIQGKLKKDNLPFRV